MSAESEKFGEVLAENMRREGAKRCGRIACGIDDVVVTVLEDETTGELNTMYSISCENEGCYYLDGAKMTDLLVAAGEVTIVELGLGDELRLKDADPSDQQ